MVSQPSHTYGLSKNLFVSRKASGDSIVVGGTGEDNTRWTRVLSYRAAQMLWFNLAELLYPEKSKRIGGLITTAPLRGADLPTITTHTAVDKTEDSNFEVTGWAGSQSWVIKLDADEVRRLWSALDAVLTPIEWSEQ
ncbi:MAG: hypothetical protein BroJett038_10200 [Chloroflexota bacterium]|nr:MAG: hypothetical protein BroJett038_10200 [Chloroflexota bacterium]